MTVGAGVLLHGTGADEVLAAPRHLLSRLLRHRGVTAARRYVRQRRAQGEAEIEHLAAALAGRIRGPRGGHFYWASTWPRLAADGGAPTLTAPMREAAVGWADAHRTESLRACRQQRMTWAEAAAMHALFPRDMLVPAGQVPERFPFLDNGFVRFAYNLPLEAKFGAGQPSAYLDHKHLVASLLPDQVLPLLPERRLRSYNGYERYWSAIPAAAPLSVELGLLAPDWASRCRDAFDKAVALSVEAWIRGALATGAAAVTDL